MARELERSEESGAAASRKLSWVESMVQPITARARENHFGRDVQLTYTPWGTRARPSDADR